MPKEKFRRRLLPKVTVILGRRLSLTPRDFRIVEVVARSRVAGLANSDSSKGAVAGGVGRTNGKQAHNQRAHSRSHLGRREAGALRGTRHAAGTWRSAGAVRGTRHAAGIAFAVSVQAGRAETAGAKGTRGKVGANTWMGHTAARGCEG